MPLYEYKCANCNQNIEIIQKFSDPPLATCPECGGSVSKVMSRTSFQLKGSGWYASDYKKPKAADTPAKAADTATPAPKAGGSDKGGSSTP
jgi:putative FmdB family regulatory protein